MNKVPAVTRKKRELQTVQPTELEVVQPGPSGGLFSFSYSFTEISMRGDKTHVKSRRTRFEGGKLTSEAFEGELGREVYERMTQQAQQMVAAQMGMVLRSMSWLLPWLGPRRE